MFYIELPFTRQWILFLNQKYSNVVLPVLLRGIEWSLRALASMRAVGLFLRARAVISFVMRAASTLKSTNGEQRALRKFSTSWNLSLLKRCFAPSNMADTFKTGQRMRKLQGNI